MRDKSLEKSIQNTENLTKSYQENEPFEECS